MRKLLRWLYILALLAVGLSAAGRTSAQSAGVSDDPCGLSASSSRGNYDPNALNCLGVGSDCDKFMWN